MIQTQSKIKQLSDVTVSRIAAGEVIERPASVIKELVENAIDANATKIDIVIEQAGKNLILVSDNGNGMSRDDLAICVHRHTTSKLNEEDIMDISSFGFRGEALPSIGSISRMTISSYDTNSKESWQIYVEGGKIMEPSISSHPMGTKIEVRDLFFATPARLKFLRSDRTELSSALDVVKKIAISHPDIAFSLVSDGKNLLKLKSTDINQRILDVLGKEFLENSISAEFKTEELSVSGLVSLPTFNRSASLDQFLFINNRPVKDKLLGAAIKVAYQDFLARDRHPVLVLFLKIDPHLVDVNVHPAKAEVRFFDTNMVRGVMISAIKNAINSSAHRVSNTGAYNTIASFKPENIEKLYNSNPNFTLQDNRTSNYRPMQTKEPLETRQGTFAPSPYRASPFIPIMPMMRTEDPNTSHSIASNDSAPNFETSEYPLGAACAQLHKTYIISQTNDSIIFTDQHAAHERLIYERIKAQINKNGIDKQRLLIPEIVELPDQNRADALAQKKQELNSIGFVFERFGEKSIILNEVPSLIADSNLQKLVHDVADNLVDLGEAVSITELIEHITETYACHYSIRSGRKMNIAEMNELLRQMESTPFSGQCNHGRPTYIELKLSDIEKLFGRR